MSIKIALTRMSTDPDTDMLSSVIERTKNSRRISARATSKTPRDCAALLLREIAANEANAAQVARLIAIADDALQGNPLIARAAIALAIERQHAARESFAGLTTLYERFLAIDQSALIGGGEARFVELLVLFGEYYVALYKQGGTTEVDKPATALITAISNASDTLPPDIDARLRLRAANALLGYSELKDSAAIRIVLDRIGEHAEQALSSDDRDVIDWWAERTVIEMFVFSRERGSDAALLAMLDAQEARLQSISTAQTSAHFKWWRVKHELARLGGNTEAAERALEALERTVAPQRRAHLMTYLRLRANHLLHVSRPLESERYAREALATADAIDAPYNDRATAANILAQALIQQSRWSDTINTLRDAESRCPPKLANYLRVTRLLIESLPTWDSDRASALQSLREGFAANREILKYMFLSTQPALATLLSARALNYGIEIDFLREAVRRRSLAPTSQSITHWPWRAQLRLFGGFELVSSAPAAKPGAKSKLRPAALLQALALCGPDGADRKTLARRVYGSSDAVEPVALDMAISRARKMLTDEQLILFDDGRFRLNRDLVFVDTWAFDELDQEISLPLETHAALANDVTSLNDLALRLTDLYTGPLLQDISTDAAIGTFVDRYRDRFTVNALAISSRLVKNNRPDIALNLLHRAIEREPYSESLYRGLIELLVERDERAEAKRWFERCESMTKTRFGVSVSKKTRALIERIEGAD